MPEPFYAQDCFSRKIMRPNEKRIMVKNLGAGRLVVGVIESNQRVSQERRELAASFGNFESLVFHPAAVWAGHSKPEELLAVGIRPSLLRLAVGLEHSDDLIADVEQALEKCAAGSRVPTGAAAG